MNALERLRETARGYANGTATLPDLLAAVRKASTGTPNASDLDWLVARLADTMNSRPGNTDNTTDPTPVRGIEPNAEITTVFTAGRTLANPGFGGWATVGVQKDRVLFDHYGSTEGVPLPRLQMHALVTALRLLPRNTGAEIVCNDKMAITIITKHAPVWRKNGWRRKNGAVANLDLVRKGLKLFEARPNCRLRWKHEGKEDPDCTLASRLAWVAANGLMAKRTRESATHPATDTAPGGRRNTENCAVPETDSPDAASTEITAVYTDGCAIPNPGIGGWAIVAIANNRIVCKRHGRAEATTSHRMEMQALIEALRALPADTEAEIVTDSKRNLKTLKVWAPKWRAAGWSRNGSRIPDADLAREALELYEARPNCRLRWVRGHAGDRWNARADRLARAAATGRAR